MSKILIIEQAIQEILLHYDNKIFDYVYFRFRLCIVGHFYLLKLFYIYVQNYVLRCLF